MEEKILIKSESISGKKLLVVLLIIGIVLSVCVFISDCVNASAYDQECYDVYLKHQKNYGEDYQCDCNSCSHIHTHPNFASYVFSLIFTNLVCLLPLISIVLLDVLIHFWIHSYLLVVTDKRVYGTVLWGLKRVDLPLDAIAAASMVKVFNIIGISTASGTIRFGCIANANDVYTVISNLLIERQENRHLAIQSAT